MGKIIKELSNNGIKLNITAVYTFEQTKQKFIKNLIKIQNLLSRFLQVECLIKEKIHYRFFKKSISLTKKKKHRDFMGKYKAYNYIQAKQIKCNIITMPPK